MPSQLQAISKRAFTLIELLVVIGIITLLIAILLPILSRAREAGNQVRCAANLRSIGHGFFLYTQTYGCYPAYAVTDFASGTGWAVWPIQIRRMLRGNQDVFYCPSQDPRCRWTRDPPPPGKGATEILGRYGYELGELLLDRQAVSFSYGLNFNGHTGRGLGSLAHVLLRTAEHRHEPYVRPGSVKKPSEMIAVADTTADGWLDFEISPLSSGWGPVGSSALPARVHGGGANLLFCDGHVQRYRQEDLVITDRLTGQSRPNPLTERMWNRDYGSSNPVNQP